MKQFYYSMLAATLSLLVLAGCSSGDDEGSFEISQLVGSEWKSSYEWLDPDDLSTESGSEVLVFTSSTRAEKTTELKVMDGIIITTLEQMNISPTVVLDIHFMNILYRTTLYI